MALRHQLPVHSPLTLGAIVAAARAARGNGDAAEAKLIATIRDRYSASDVVLTNSGTSALTLALDSLRRAGRGPVALPAYACFDIATAAVGAGIDVMLYDVDPETLGPDSDSLRAALAAGARSIVVSYLYGYPIDLDVISALAAEYDAIVIEDAAQGAGGTWRGIPLGSFGAASVLSFGRGKGTTGGGGGALLWRDAAEAALGPVLRPDGAASGTRAAVSTAAQWLLARPAVYALPAALPFLHLGDTTYHPPSTPAGASAFSVALVSRTWESSAAEVGTRRANAARLLAALPPTGSARPPRAAQGADPGYLRLPLVFDAEMAARARTSAARRLGIMPGYPLPLEQLEQWQMLLRNSAAAFPGASELSSRLFTLPTHGMLSRADLVRLEGWLWG